MSGLIKTWLRRFPVNTCVIVNPVELRWHSKSEGKEGEGGLCVRSWRDVLREPFSFFYHHPLRCNTLDPLVTNTSWWLSDGPSKSLNLLLINLSLCITLNIRSGRRGTGGICLCITGGRPLLEKPARFISVIKWCVYSLKEALGVREESQRSRERRIGRDNFFLNGTKREARIKVVNVCVCVCM